MFVSFAGEPPFEGEDEEEDFDDVEGWRNLSKCYFFRAFSRDKLLTGYENVLVRGTHELHGLLGKLPHAISSPGHLNQCQQRVILTKAIYSSVELSVISVYALLYSAIKIFNNTTQESAGLVHPRHISPGWAKRRSLTNHNDKCKQVIQNNPKRRRKVLKAFEIWTLHDRICHRL